MEIPEELTDEQLAYWQNADGMRAVHPLIMRAPEGVDDCGDCVAVHTLTDDGAVYIRVPWKPNEVDLAALARGGTLWLSTLGGLPPHSLEVQPPAVVETARRVVDSPQA